MDRMTTIWAVSLVIIAVTATTGKTAETSTGASDPTGVAANAAVPVAESVPWSFGVTSSDGQFPLAGLLSDTKGNLYGTTTSGGAYSCAPGCGTVFELSRPIAEQTQWDEHVLWSFGASGDGADPLAGLIGDKKGNLYGTTAGGGANGGGTVFALSSPFGQQTHWRETILWSFGVSGDGQFPFAGLLSDAKGNLYGTTEGGGANSEGTVFELSPPIGPQTQWNERVLWSFGASGDGADPLAGLIADKKGNLYGTTAGGGANGGGTVFALSPPVGQQTQWRESVLWNFGASGDGQSPFAGLLSDTKDNLYGTTEGGGANTFPCGPPGTSCGTVFELSPPIGPQTQWNERVLWSFGASGDGADPLAGLIADKKGNLYGTTNFGGTIYSCFEGVSCGTVFELSRPIGRKTRWDERVLWSFGASGDGRYPSAGLLSDKWGNLYGTTELGGTTGEYGEVFEISPP